MARLKRKDFLRIYCVDNLHEEMKSFQGCKCLCAHEWGAK